MSTGTTTLPPRLTEALKEIHISPDGSEAVVHGREVTSDNPREMRRLLSEALYDVLHSGRTLEKGTISFRMRDEEFEGDLARGVPHRETTTRARVCAAEGHGGTETSPLLVERDGVRVWVPRALVVDGDSETPGAVVTLRTAALRPALSPGFFMVDGSRPRPPGRDVLRVYVNITSWQEAPAVWATVLGHLEDTGTAYRAKVLSAKPLYPRRDSLVVYLAGDTAHAARGIADAVATTPGVGHETSVYTEELAPGVATAWEPDDRRPGMTGLSFGQHRASITAHALLDAAKSGEPVEALLTAAFIEAGVDPANPARNSGHRA
ncbi:T3SS effector HopA1 family protein [Streptomyces syringium]|uniref:T3SS effector HopA1 family protein n=1 Tax=Streptomyces syringium TaxID=76729 RepID=UPI0034137873